MTETPDRLHINQMEPQPKHLVLYADDDPDDLKFVEDAFQQQVSNIELITANDGVAALSFLNRLTLSDPHPCLIILDVNMPRLNGKEVLQKIRQMERFEKIPVVLFTTSSLPPDRFFAEKYNAGFITKPLNNHQMQSIAHQFIEHCEDSIRKSIRKIIN
jgi:CheY-like chemotaxis protein